MIKLAILLAVSLLAGCATTPHPRNATYYTAGSLMVADGWSTSYALQNPNARETGYLATRLFGDRPNDLQIASMVGINLGFLEWSRYWDPALRSSFQWGILLTRPFIISVNYRIGAKNAN